MTPLFFVNFFVFQWFFVRLAKTDVLVTAKALTMQEKERFKAEWERLASRERPRLVILDNGTKLAFDWRFIGPVVPLTGWWSDFVYLWRPTR